MRFAVISHKPCWVSPNSTSGYASDGGFPYQMRALSELFDSTVLVLPRSLYRGRNGEVPLVGHNLNVMPLTHCFGRGILRKFLLPFWFLLNSFVLIREVLKADAVHTPIPGDIGTIGMVLAFFLHKRLFVRHCGNWFVQKTPADIFRKWFMERFAGGKNVMLATGGDVRPPSQRNPSIRWIFATSLTEQDLKIYARPRHKLPQETIRLIIVCRQERDKGTAVIIKTLPIIIKDFPRVGLDVVGDGRGLREFKKLAQTIRVSNRVTFYGRVSHKKVIQLLKQADLFCFPTASEGFPKAVLEALACGLPVITTRVSVLPQLINTGCGILIDAIAPQAIAHAVKVVLSDAERYGIMSKIAIETACQYSLERWRGIIGAILQEAWGRLGKNTQLRQS